MFKENLEEKLLVAWSDKIETPSAKAALRYLVGWAACSPDWICHPQWKGYLPDFRFHESTSEEQFFSFVPAQKWLLFYFRPPALKKGRYDVEELTKCFPEVVEKSGEQRVRIHTLADASLLTRYLEAGRNDA